MSTTVESPNPGVKKQSVLGKMLLSIFGIGAVIGLMLWAFLGPMFASGPKDVPIALAGPDQVVEKITQAAEANAGEDAPSFETYGSDEEVRDAIMHRDVVGGIALGQQGATAYTAAGNGAPYVQMVNGIAGQLEAQGMPVEHEDLAPTTQDDPQATGIGLLGLPLAFGGIISAVIATFVFRGQKWAKIAVVTGIAIAGGLVATWMLHSVYGTLGGSFGMEWLATSMGILATSMLTAGLAALIGTAGIGIGAVLTIFVGNPLSGLATGPWMLPHAGALIGQWMPIGATGHLVRSLAFFDGLGAHHSWWTLAIWIVVGFGLLLFDRSHLPEKK